MARLVAAGMDIIDPRGSLGVIGGTVSERPTRLATADSEGGWAALVNRSRRGGAGSRHREGEEGTYQERRGGDQRENEGSKRVM